MCKRREKAFVLLEDKLSKSLKIKILPELVGIELGAGAEAISDLY